jgi:hypothetical protein
MMKTINRFLLLIVLNGICGCGNEDGPIALKSSYDLSAKSLAAGNIFVKDSDAFVLFENECIMAGH